MTKTFSLQWKYESLFFLHLVRSMNCHTSTSSKYIDFHPQPIVKNMTLYVRDNIDLFQIIGRAMDTICPTAYANVFIEEFEK